MGYGRGIVVRGLGCLAAAGALSAVLAGCDGATATSDAAALRSTALVAASLDKEATFPGYFFEIVGEDDPQGCLSELGCTDVEVDEDGDYTATVPADAYEGLVEGVRALAASAIDALPGDDAYPDVTAVDYDEQFATVTVTLSSETLLPEDATLPYIPGTVAVVYQEVAGLPVGCDVILVGSDGSELSSTVFPLQDASAEGAATASGAE